VAHVRESLEAAGNSRMWTMLGLNLFDAALKKKSRKIYWQTCLETKGSMQSGEPGGPVAMLLA